MTRHVYLALGRPGTGKTRHLAGVVRRAIAERPMLTVIHDVRMGRPGAWDEDAIGCLAPEEARFECLEAMVAVADENDGHVPMVCSVYQDEALALSDLAWARAEQLQLGTRIVWDELDQLPQRIERKRPDHDRAYRCLQYGRTFPVDIYGSIRQPQRCDPQWFACATEVALFQLTGDLQLQRIRQSGWPDADQLAVAASGLAEYQYLLVQLRGG